jgi:tRNA pseudouridine38-40 synthase
MRFRAVLAYDGMPFHGFQRQANASPTVQGEVEAALYRLAGQPIGVLAAGRTDAGVHAAGQVIAFDLAWGHAPVDLRNALNANLPETIAIRSVNEAAPDFHPRFDALSREYVYEAYVAPVRDPLRREQAWHIRSTLDGAAMGEAAECLVGEHDFSAFGTPPQGDNPVRTVYEARWEEAPADEHRFTITANAFLYHMVRSIVGTLVLVGMGRMTVEAFRGILAARERSLAGAAAPPHGLTLVRVNY